MKVVTKVAAALLLTAVTAAPALAATTTTKTTVAKTTVVAHAPKPAPKAAAKVVVAAKAPSSRVLTLKQIDKNRDGKVAYVELKAFYPKLTKGGFAVADSNHNGSLDVKELVAFFKAPVLTAPHVAHIASAKPTKPHATVGKVTTVSKTVVKSGK